MSRMDTRMLIELSLLLLGVIHSHGQLSPINITLSVAEENSNLVIGHLLREAGIAAAREPQVQLQILRGDHAELFRVDGDRLSSSGPLDREALCGSDASPCRLQLDVAVLVNSQLNRMLNVVITLLDINDNSPVFAESNITISIPQEAAIGTSFDLPTATDKDSGQNSVQAYALSSNVRSLFSIHNSVSSDGTVVPKLILNNMLPADLSHQKVFELVAYDSGTPLKSGSLTITVDVMRTNEHAPEFSHSMYDVTVDENASVPRYLLTVDAEDDDIGVNGEIRYWLESESNVISTDGNLFINQTSGDVYLMHTLDREQRAVYHYDVIATDGGMKHLSARTELTLFVNDVNDCRPRINIDTSTNSNYSVVTEGSPVGTFVALVSAEDDDSGVNGQVNCTSMNPDFRLTFLYGNYYQLITAAELDFESQENYSVAIVCHDKGEASLRASDALDIYVIDLNDNPPVFDSTLYNVSVHENLPVHTSLVTVSAHDIDTGENGRVYYVIEDPSVRAWVSVNSTSGVITNLIPFDHERIDQRNIEVIVKARDAGTPPQEATARVLIQVADVNDEAPVFSSIRTFSIAENVAVGSLVGRVHASDADSRPFNRVEYFISNETVDAKTFSIERSTGKLRTLRMLDREQRPALFIKVLATDTAPPFHTSSAEITVFLQDENDNKPTVLFPSNNNDTVHVSLRNEVRYKVTQVLARDADIGRNGELLYTILNGNDKQCFEIDTHNGEVFADGLCLQSAMISEYILNIFVEDLGTPSYFTDPILRLKIDLTTIYAPDSRENELVTSKQPSSKDAKLKYHLKVAIILGALALLLLILLVCLITCIKSRQRAQRRACAKYINEEEMVRLSGSHRMGAGASPDAGTLLVTLFLAQRSVKLSKHTARISRRNKH